MKRFLWYNLTRVMRATKRHSSVQLFALVVGFLMLAFVYQNIRAASVPGVVDIFVTTSSYSYVDTYNTQSPLTPLVGTTKSVYVNGRVTDGDGVGTGFADGDLQSVDLRFYRENVGVSCTPDVNNCYQVSCTVTANSSTVLNYSCAVSVSYLADSTMAGGAYPNEVWNAEVIVKDDADQVGSLIKQFEVQTLLALTIPTSVAFGTFAPGDETTSLNNIEYTLTQQGNDVASVMISGSSMTCTGVGSIPVGNMTRATIDVGATHASATSVTATPTDAGLSIGTNDTGSLSQNLYLNLIMPLGVAGGCTGTLTVEASSA